SHRNPPTLRLIRNTKTSLPTAAELGLPRRPYDRHPDGTVMRHEYSRIERDLEELIAAEKRGGADLAAKTVDAEREADAERARFEKYKAELTRGGGLVSRRFEWCKDWIDVLEEWDDILWI